MDAMILLLNRRGKVMQGFVQGVDRQQTTLLPECLEDWVGENNSIRAVDVFVDALELRDLGFDGVDPAATALRTSNVGSFVPKTDFASTKQCCTWDGLAVARLTPTQATGPHAGRTHPLRYLRRARCEPFLWRVSVARPRHFRGAQTMGRRA